MPCDDNTQRLHEARMKQTEDRVMRLEGQSEELRKEMSAQIRLITTEIAGVRLDVQKAVSEGMRAIVEGAAGDAREAITTAKSAHHRVDDVADDVRDLQNAQNRLAGKVAVILAAIGMGGAGIWNVISKFFGGS